MIFPPKKSKEFYDCNLLDKGIEKRQRLPLFDTVPSLRNKIIGDHTRDFDGLARKLCRAEPSASSSLDRSGTQKRVTANRACRNYVPTLVYQNLDRYSTGRTHCSSSRWI